MMLTADKITAINGVTVKQYFLTEHNPNHIAMPCERTGNSIGITLHNTNRINVSAGTTCAEQYLRATVNGNMGTVRVHYYVDDVCAWQGLPLNWQSWHAGQRGKSDAYGSERGNAQTISIECIMDGTGTAADCKARDNAARLIAWLIDEYGGEIYTHNYWCNVRNGKCGDIDTLNTKNDGYKNCPVFIRPKWADFVELVDSYRAKKSSDTENVIYRVQVGAFANKSNADAYARGAINSGFSAIIKTVRRSDDVILYRVQLGAFACRSNAEKYCEQAKKLGYDAFIV